MDRIELTKAFVSEKLSDDTSGHDWLHTKRVYTNSLKLLKETEDTLDREVVILVSLLHDIADWKFTGGDESVGPKIADEWLRSIGTKESVIQHVCEIIEDISFKGSVEHTPMRTIEGEIVQDADRLDALGAIGIARTFAYGGYKGQEMYNPDIAPKTHQSKTEYKKQNTTSINHFYEKLLLLKKRMNTQAGQQLAEERHQYMLGFLDEFLKECGAENTVHNEQLIRYK